MLAIFASQFPTREGRDNQSDEDYVRLTNGLGDRASEQALKITTTYLVIAGWMK